MALIPFNIKKVKDTNKYRVVTRNHKPVRILCDNKADPHGYQIVGLVKDTYGNESMHLFNINGRCYADKDSEYDLFLSTESTTESDFTNMLTDLLFTSMLVARKDILGEVSDTECAALLAEASKIAEKNGSLLSEVAKSNRSFTGVYDKNGTPIFNGDVVTTKYGRVCRVTYKKLPGFVGFDFETTDTNHPIADQYDLWDSENLEVVELA